MYFKDDVHKENTYDLLSAFKRNTLEEDRDIGTFCYIASAVYKHEDIAPLVGIGGINMEGIEEKLLFYSNSEQAMIRFAIQHISDHLDDITLPEVMRSLDEENKKVILTAIQFRYRITN